MVAMDPHGAWNVCLALSAPIRSTTLILSDVWAAAYGEVQARGGPMMAIITSRWSNIVPLATKLCTIANKGVGVAAFVLGGLPVAFNPPPRAPRCQNEHLERTCTARVTTHPSNNSLAPDVVTCKPTTPLCPPTLTDRPTCPSTKIAAIRKCYRTPPTLCVCTHPQHTLAAAPAPHTQAVVPRRLRGPLRAILAAAAPPEPLSSLPDPLAKSIATNLQKHRAG
jgi:hypothetical protein